MQKRKTYHNRADVFWENKKRMFNLKNITETNKYGKEPRCQGDIARRPTSIRIYHKINRQNASGKTNLSKIIEYQNNHRTHFKKQPQPTPQTTTIPRALTKDKKINHAPIQKKQTY